jgi:hypothetical protein
MDILMRVSPRDIRGYAISKGWVRRAEIGKLWVFGRADLELDQLLVPKESTRSEYPDRVWEAVLKLVEFERRPPMQIVTDILNYDADVLRYRVVSDRAERDTLPLNDAMDLLAGASRSLLSAAHSVIVPQKYHPKLSRSEATTLLDACQMGQTERGSFVLTISCPLRAVDEDQAGLAPLGKPFARRATELLTQALAKLDWAIEEDRVNEIVDEQDPIVSANLCESLLQMRPTHEHASLVFAPSWAPSTPADQGVAALGPQITFSADEFDYVEDVYRQLRPTEGPQAKPWLAFVEELRGVDGPDGRREGEVVFYLFDEGESIKARARLDADQYQTAYEAHNPTLPLFVRGVLHRGPRVSRLTEVADIRAAKAEDIHGE